MKKISWFSVSVAVICLLFTNSISVGASHKEFESNTSSYRIVREYIELEKEIEKSFYVNDEGNLIILDELIRKVIYDFDFAPINRALDIEIDNESYYLSVISNIELYPLKSYSNNEYDIVPFWIEFPQCNKSAVEYRWNSTRLWVPSDKVNDAAEALLGDLDLASDNGWEMAIELYSYSKRAIAAQQMKDRNSGCGVIVDMNFYLLRIVVAAQNGQDPFK